MIRKGLLIVWVCCALLLSRGAAMGVPRAVEEGWMWQILVYPPGEGWESSQGHAIHSALELIALRANERHYGIQDHDIRFLYQPPLPPEDEIYEILREERQKWKKEKVAGALSFASDRKSFELFRCFEGTGIPLLLAYGEEIPLREEYGAPKPYLFALDLYLRYREAAFAHAAPSLCAADSGIVVFSDRLDPVLSRSATYLAQELGVQGMIPMPVWSAGAMDRDVKPSLIEAEHAGASVLVNVMGLMEALDLWSTLKSMKNPFALWHAGPLDPILERRSRILALSQQWRIDHDKTLRDLRNELWYTLHQRPRDLPLTGRAYALGMWLVRGLENARDVPGLSLVHALERAEKIPFGEEMLSINPQTHRPMGRIVTLIESTGSSWQFIKDFRVRSAAFPE